MPPDDFETDDTVSFTVVISFYIQDMYTEEAKEYADKICKHYPGYEPQIESIDEVVE